MATGILSPGQIAPPLRHVLRKHKNVKVELAEVDRLRPRPHGRARATQLPTCTRWRCPYDSLIVAAGADQSYFGHDEFAMFAPGMKTIDDALELRRRIFGAFEMAEIATDAAEQREWLTIVIVGAGPDRRRDRGPDPRARVAQPARRLPHLRPASVRVLLVDGGKEPLATFGHHLSQAAARALERSRRRAARWVRASPTSTRSGVDVSTKRRHDRAHRRAHRDLGRGRAGVAARRRSSPRRAGAEVDRAGRITVLPDLTLPGHPEVFAVGDMISLDELPGVAEVAMQGSLHAANTIGRRLRGRRRAPSRSATATSGASRPSVASAPSSAVGRIRLSGLPGVGRVGVRAPRVPQRVRQPLHHAAALGPLDDRAHPGRARRSASGTPAAT